MSLSRKETEGHLISPFCEPSFNPGLFSVGFILVEEAMREEFLSVPPVLAVTSFVQGYHQRHINLLNDSVDKQTLKKSCPNFVLRARKA